MEQERDEAHAAAVAESEAMVRACAAVLLPHWPGRRHVVADAAHGLLCAVLCALVQADPSKLEYARRLIHDVEATVEATAATVARPGEPRH